MAGRRSLLHQRGFVVFLAAQTLSVGGDAFALIAVPLLVLRATGSVAQMGLLTGVAGGAAVAAVAALAGPDRVTEANGLLYAASSAAGIAGTLLAGVVSGLFRPAAAIGVDALSFAVSAAGLTAIRFGRLGGLARPGRASRSRPGRWPPRMAPAGGPGGWPEPVSCGSRRCAASPGRWRCSSSPATG